MLTEFFLSRFKFYRKRKGGVWYKVSHRYNIFREYWINELPEYKYETILKIESYKVK